MNSKRPLFIGALLLVQLLTGCTGVLESTVEPRAALTATPTEIQQGEEVTFDARASDAIEGVITEYSWDFWRWYRSDYHYWIHFTPVPKIRTVQC